MKIKIKPSEIKYLAPMSASVSRLANMVLEPDATSGEIARVIELDGALTANVLRWANSAWYSARVPIQSVKAAVVRLGMNNILKLAVGSCLASPMKKSLPGYELVENELWRHNVAAALTVEHIGEFTNTAVHPAAFTGALIHDIGKLVLSRHLDRQIIGQIQELVKMENITYFEAERQILETDHAEVGAAISGYWKFPESLTRAIEKHHDPEPEPDNLLDMVIIANTVAKLIGVGLGNGQQNININEEVILRQGLTLSELESLCSLVKDKLDEAVAQWRI